jgi:aminoglycoside/choline kinase family phosphotransferase
VTDTRLCVRLDDLAETVRRLTEVEEHLGAATGAVADVPSVDAADVRAGLQLFSDHWERGVRTLHDTTSALRQALGSVRLAYHHHESALRSSWEAGR